MDPESSAKDIQAFYSQASLYRCNQEEKQVVEKQLEGNINEKRKKCKEIADQIKDPYNQEDRLVFELNKERESLASLYVKQIILNSEEAPFTAYYSSHLYNYISQGQPVEEVLIENSANEESTENSVEEISTEELTKESVENSVKEASPEQLVEEDFVQKSVQEVSTEKVVEEESSEQSTEEDNTKGFIKEEQDIKVIIEEPVAETVFVEQFVEEFIDKCIEEISAEQVFKESFVEEVIEEDNTNDFVEDKLVEQLEDTHTEQTPEEDNTEESVDDDFTEQFEEVTGKQIEDESVDQLEGGLTEYYTEETSTKQYFEETRNNQTSVQMSDLRSDPSSPSNSPSEDESDRYEQHPSTHGPSSDLTRVIMTQHLIDTADSIVQSALEEHSKDHVSSHSTLKRTQEMESLYEPEEMKDFHLEVKEEGFHSASSPNLQLFYNEGVGKSHVTQELAHEIPAEKHGVHGSHVNETSSWYHTHVNRPPRPLVDTVDPDHNTKTDFETHLTWRQVHVSQPERSFYTEPEVHEKVHKEDLAGHDNRSTWHKVHVSQPERTFHTESQVHKDKDAEEHDNRSTWHKVHVSQPVRMFSEPVNPEHHSEADSGNTQLIEEKRFSESEEHGKAIGELKELKNSIWHNTHINQPYRAEVQEVHPVEHDATPTSHELHSVWRDVHVQRADEPQVSYTSSYFQKFTSPSSHYSAAESGKPVSPSEWKEPEPLVPSGSTTPIYKVHQSYQNYQSYQPESNSDASHSSDLSPDAEEKVKSQLSTWLNSRKSQEEQEAQVHQNIQVRSVVPELPAHNEDPEEEWVYEEEETVYSVISADEASNIFNTSDQAHVHQPKFDNYSVHHKTHQGFGYDKFKEIEREAVQEENVKNKPALRSSTDSQWKSSDSHWSQGYEKSETQHSPRQIEIQSPRLSSEFHDSTKNEAKDIPGIVLSTPPNEPPGSDEEYEIVPHVQQDIQTHHNDQEDNNSKNYDIREKVTSHQDPATEKREEIRYNTDVKIRINQDSNVTKSPITSQEEYNYSGKYTSAPIRPSGIDNQSAESPTRRSPEKVFNRYEDDIVIERPKSGPNQKVKVVYGSGYDYFKEIERSTVQEDKIGSAATIRSSTDRGWQTPDSDGNTSPLPNYNSPSPVDRTKQWEPTPERRTPNPDYVYVPVRVSPTPSPTKDEPDYISHKKLEEASEIYSKKTESYHYSSSSEPKRTEFRRSEFVDSPAFSPMSAEEQPKPITPTKVEKTVRFHESTYDPTETKKLDSPAPISYSPVHSKVFTITEKPQVPERVKVTGWESSPQEEENITTKPQSPLDYTPRNRDLIFDESVAVDKEHELYKARTFRKEHEKKADSYETEWKKAVQVVEVKKPLERVDYEGRALPSRRYEASEEVRNRYIVEEKPQPRTVHVKNVKVPAWRISRESESNDEPDHRHHADIADVDVHEQIRAEQLARQQKLEEKQGYKVIKTTTTIYGSSKPTSPSYITDDSENIRRAVTEAAEKHVISAKISRSPITTTPPSTPVTTEPMISAPLPKLSRSVYKNLERSVVEEELQHRERSGEQERAAMEEKKKITEQALRYPGRHMKSSQENIYTAYSESQMEDSQSDKKYFISEVPKPRNVIFAPRPVKSSSDQFPNAEVVENEISQIRTIPASSENFIVQRTPEHFTATASRRQDPAPVREVKEDFEDFRQSKTFVQYKENSKQREDLAWKSVEVKKEVEDKEPEKVVLARPTPRPRYQRPPSKPEPVFVEPKFIFNYLQQPSINSVTKKYALMPELEDGIPDSLVNGMLKQEESDVTRNWNPVDLLNTLYKVDYERRIEEKRSKFRNMEGHLEIPNDEITVPEVEKEWKKVYFRTKDSRLQWFASKYADEHPIGDLCLCDAEIIPNRENFTITVVTKAEPKQTKVVVRVPSHLFEKWRQSLLSHRDSNVLDAYVQPFTPPIPHFTEKIVLVELGSCSIRAGILTNKPSLPQSFFPALGCITDNGEIIVGSDALRPDVRHRGQLARPIDVAENSVERYKLNKEVLNACLSKAIKDLDIRPENYTVLLSIPQNIPNVFTSDLLNILLTVHNFKAASIARQPSLILYSYDVTTGIVVDIGERLNIVPVIDEYIVENAIVSLPFGAQQIRDSLRQNLKQRNNGLYSYQSPVEHTLLRYIVEQVCYVSADSEDDDHEPSKTVDLSSFKLAPGMENKITVDESRFHATEGLFNPKKWSLEIKGLHQLIHNAIQLSPIDSRRTLYKNIYLSGGTSLLHGMAERIENEISKLVPGTIQVKVHMSPWRYHAAYLGAQVIASGKLFNKCCATKENLSEYLKMLETSAYANGN